MANNSTAGSSGTEERPLSFTEIRDAINNGDLHLLKRCAVDQTIYRARMAELKAEWKSAGDFIINDKFGLPYMVDDSTNKKFVPRPLPRMDTRPTKFALLENDFPYHFEDDVKHLLLWKLGSDVVVTADDIEASMAEVKARYKVKDYCYFINPPELKSILDVSHAHIIVQLRAKRGMWRYAKYAVWSMGGVGVLYVGKYVHTLFRLREMEREVRELLANFGLGKATRLYIKYFVPFPISVMYSTVLNLFLRGVKGGAIENDSSI